MIDEDFLEDIDIVDFISRYVDLEFKNGEYWGLSPFSDERTPSFSVRQETGVWYDFSSGKSGGIISFVKNYFLCNRRQAIEILKEYYGIDGDLSTKPRPLAATAVCKKYAKPQKKQKESIAKELPENYMDKYEIRLDKLQAWIDEGISEESLRKFNVRYDALSNRLVYPIRNLEGQIVNIGGRTLNPNWHDLGLRKYTYFQKWGTIDLIFGLYENFDAIKQKREVIIFEGVKSVMLADTWGIQNTACILTSHLSYNQMKILAKLGCRVVFALDKDVQVLQDKNIQKLKRYINVEFIFDNKKLLRPKDSPVDQGVEVFKKLYNDCRFKVR